NLKTPAAEVSGWDVQRSTASTDRDRSGRRSGFGCVGPVSRYNSEKVGGRKETPAPARTSKGSTAVPRKGRALALRPGLNPVTVPTKSSRSAGYTESAPPRSEASSEIPSETISRRWIPA